MPKISEAGGPTDAQQPGYEVLGRSVQSPNVVANADAPSEASYNDAMTRHGTDDYTDQDAETVAAYQSARKADADEEIEQAENRGVPGDYSDLTYSELQQLCRERDLPATGTAEVLTDRLQANDRERDA